MTTILQNAACKYLRTYVQVHTTYNRYHYVQRVNVPEQEVNTSVQEINTSVQEVNTSVQEVNILLE